jgi:transcriptional regulator NrdR family protein
MPATLPRVKQNKEIKWSKAIKKTRKILAKKCKLCFTGFEIINNTISAIISQSKRNLNPEKQVNMMAKFIPQLSQKKGILE